MVWNSPQFLWWNLFKKGLETGHVCPQCNTSGFKRPQKTQFCLEILLILFSHQCTLCEQLCAWATHIVHVMWPQNMVLKLPNVNRPLHMRWSNPQTSKVSRTRLLFHAHLLLYLFQPHNSLLMCRNNTTRNASVQISHTLGRWKATTSAREHPHQQQSYMSKELDSLCWDVEGCFSNSCEKGEVLSLPWLNPSLAWAAEFTHTSLREQCHVGWTGPECPCFQCCWVCEEIGFEQPETRITKTIETHVWTQEATTPRLFVNVEMPNFGLSLLSVASLGIQHDYR